MKDKIFGVLQRVGRSFMLPIAILPVAGLLLGLGGSLTNETMLETYGLMGVMGPGTFLNAVFQVMSDAGNIVFANLPIIFAMGVAIGMAKKEKEVAALAAAIAFFIMHASIGAMIANHGGADRMLSGATASVCGITSLQMGVFGGILVGLGVAALHNKFYKIELPQVLSWAVDNYYYPGKRETLFLGQRVEKQHHTLTQILNPLPRIGFRLEAVEEAEPSAAMREKMPDEMRRPMMLLVKAVRE